MNILGEIGGIFLTAILSIFTLFLLAKLIGNRQISQMSMFDYINGITIGSIAAELATNLDEWHKSLTALILFGFITFLIDFISDKSIKARRLIEGRTKLIYDNGKIYRGNLAKAHVDLGEFLTLCRCQGYFNLQDIQTAYLESNGQISILPKATKRPTNPEDFGLNPTQDFSMATVIMDGKILYHNLHTAGKDEKWLMKQVHDKGIKNIKSVMLATCSVDNQLDVYVRIDHEIKDDLFG